MKQQWFQILGMAMVVMSAFAGQAHASGSDGSGGLQTADTRLYNIGKGVYLNKIACKSCPMPGKKLDAEAAEMLMSSKSVESALSADERQALNTYLSLRFKR